MGHERHKNVKIAKFPWKRGLAPLLGVVLERKEGYIGAGFACDESLGFKSR